MPSFDDIYASKFLKHTDFRNPDKVSTLLITNYELDEVRNPKTNKRELRVLLSLRGTEKRLIVSAHNAHKIAEYYGKEFDDWVGQPIWVRIEVVDSFGEKYDVIRVVPRRENPKWQENGNQPPPATQPPPVTPHTPAESPKSVQESVARAAAAAPPPPPDPVEQVDEPPGITDTFADADDDLDAGRPYDDDIPF